MMGSNTQNRKNASGSRSDIGWEHGIEVENNPRKIKCKYCDEIISGNIYRFKHHLACTKKDVKACNNVPVEVKEDMSKLVAKGKMINDEEEEMVGSVRYKRAKRLTESFSNITIGITQSTPSCHELKNSSVDNEMKITTDKLEEHKIIRKKTGCSIICDEWVDKKGSSYCKFLVNFPGYTIFQKSIDTSDISEKAEKVFKALDEIIKEIGEENVVQVITNDTANYKVVAEMLIKMKRWIFHSPCVVQLLDEILEDFEKKLSNHRITIVKGKKISAFIDSTISGWLQLSQEFKAKAKLTYLTGPTITPSADVYLNLLYLSYMKEPLKDMFQEFQLAETKEGEDIQQIIKDDEFWNDVFVCLKFALPIIEVLLKIDSDEKPNMGFIHRDVLHAQGSVQLLKNAKEHKTILEIIQERLKPLFHSQYTASYFLNPQLHNASKLTDESIKSICAYLAKMVMAYNDNSKVTQENQLQQIKNQFDDFLNSKGLFGSLNAINERYTKDPAEWWDSYGNHCPELQKIAIRLLSLTCCSWVHPSKRNCTYQAKLDELNSIIQRFKSETGERIFLNISCYDLRIENEVGEVSIAYELAYALE